MTSVSDTTRRVNVPAAGRYRLDPFRSLVCIRTRLLGVRPLRGTLRFGAGEVTIDPDGPRASVFATVHAASFSSGHGSRDDDVRSARFLDAEKYPDLTFQASELSRRGQRWMLTGELTVREVSKQVTLAIESIEEADAGFRARARTRLDRYAFGLTAMRRFGGRFYEIEVFATADQE